MANFTKIKEISREKGIKMTELADRVGITDAALSILIKNNSTSTKTIESIAHELNVPVGIFFDSEPIQSVPQIDEDSIILTPKILAIINEKDKRIQELTDKLINRQ